MKLLITILFLFGFVAVATNTNAGHVRGNGTCTDDIKHWKNMEHKRTDAPLHEQSKRQFEKALGKKLAAKPDECEALMEEALRMIRKPYPTE